MKLAFVYSGQGSQYAGMGKEFYEKCGCFRKVFDEANVGFDIREVCFEDRMGRLNETTYTQPCMVAYQVGVTRMLMGSGIHPEYVAGISLGEFSALYASGVWDAKTVLELVAYRGKAMEDCVKGMKCSTVSVLGLPNEIVEKICSDVKCGVVAVTNYYCDGNVTIGGEKDAVDEAILLAKVAGAKYCIPSKSAYPFHTSLLKNVGEELFRYIDQIELHPMMIPVVFNYTGRTLSDKEDVAHLLEMQVQSSIRWKNSIDFLVQHGIDTVVDIGPGEAASKLIVRTLPDITTYTIKTFADLQAIIKKIKYSIVK